jgi:hypothetical protein
MAASPWNPRRWSLLCFDVAAGIARWHWPRADQWPRAPNEPRCNDFAIEPGGRRVALTNGNRLEVFDLASLERLLCFPIDQVVKRSMITWLGSRSLGVHTD